MSEMSQIYTFNGKDITMNVCIQIKDTIKIIQQRLQLSFPDAMGKFYSSNTYNKLAVTENGLWAESAEYIAERYFEEIEK